MLVDYLRKMDTLFYGLDRYDLSTIAFDFARENKIPTPFRNGRAGEQWLQNFRKRHPEISLRQPESTSLARARGFNRPQVERFFTNLQTVMEKYKFTKSMVWNVDETGIQNIHPYYFMVMKKPCSS